MTTIHNRPWWLGLAVLALGGICLYSAAQLPATAQYASIGPGMALMGVGGGLLILGVLLLAQIAQGVAFEPDDAENVDASRPMDKRAFATALVAIALPALLLRALGLPLTAMLSFMLVARALGSRRLGLDLFTGLLLGSAGWWLFSALGLQLGDFLPLMGKGG
ncbi:MAG: tripartite tricarboxylate transporter TctB family protein [Comamonadaceae bacterium]|nr:tripartite tricarboxylate transporter TctB family protein [Comamonadaceae bacterium]